MTKVIVKTLFQKNLTPPLLPKRQSWPKQPKSTLPSKDTNNRVGKQCSYNRIGQLWGQEGIFPYFYPIDVIGKRVRWGLYLSLFFFWVKLTHNILCVQHGDSTSTTFTISVDPIRHHTPHNSNTIPLTEFCILCLLFQWLNSFLTQKSIFHSSPSP